MKPHIGVLTSGGDCPGLNAALRAPTRWTEFLRDVDISFGD
jgi:6-phosphofructokinase